MSYEARIAEISFIRPLPNADRLQIATVLGSSVVVGLDVKKGDIVVFFDSDGQLSHEMCYNNNLYQKQETNKDPNKKGYFDHKRRVRAQLFRGAKSEAFIIGLESLKFTGYDISKLEIGNCFNELNGVHICNKYFTPATLRSAKKNEPKIQSGYNKEALKKLFPEHKDTDQFRFATDQNLQGLCIFTSKIHGTSFRVGNIYYPIKQENKWYHTFWNTFVDEIFHGPKHIFNFFLSDKQKEDLKIYPKEKKEWQIIHGTRRVIKGKVDEKATDYRSLSALQIAPFIEKGEIWYGEIVGYEDSGASIMQKVSTAEMPKEFKKRFGDTITYKYGCLPGTCDIYIYRITYQNENGAIYELPWGQVKNKCIKAGIKHVPEIDQRLVISESDVAKLKEIVEYYTEIVDIAEPIDPSHIKEGICIRRESFIDGSTKIWKNKTMAFKILEGIAKADETYIDTEEQEALGENDE